ncbi:hypothetical protein ACFQ3Z_25085 [Streptomyces nogalater]
MAAQADRRRAGPLFMAHLVIVPDQRRVVELLVGDLALLALRHWHSLAHPYRPFRMPSTLRRWWLSPYCRATCAA